MSPKEKLETMELKNNSNIKPPNFLAINRVLLDQKKYPN